MFYRNSHSAVELLVSFSLAHPPLSSAAILGGHLDFTLSNVFRRENKRSPGCSIDTVAMAMILSALVSLECRIVRRYPDAARKMVLSAGSHRTLAWSGNGEARVPSLVITPPLLLSPPLFVRFASIRFRNRMKDLMHFSNRVSQDTWGALMTSEALEVPLASVPPPLQLMTS